MQNFIMTLIYLKAVNTTINDLKYNGNKVNVIATSVLVGSKHIIAPIISHLINLYCQQGYFPNNLKLGCITPIYKSGDREKVNNYRPVCSLSPFSKIIEKAINNCMVKFIDKHNIFSKTQYGFRKNMGTDTALSNFTDTIQKALNEKKHTISVFLDLSKAFDVINHNILKMKLGYYGFRGKFLDFLMCFVRDRKYFVHVNGIDSETKIVNIGVPQGSTLGPLLFLLYVNDMAYISELLHLLQFADDSTITYSSHNLDIALEHMETEFRHILDWLAANKLIINLSKTHLMVFTNRVRPQSISINANGHTINEITQTKFLGIILDNKLCWDAHIKHVTLKVSKTISLFRILKWTLPTNILKMLYYTMVFPYFNYCNAVWGGAANTHINQLVLLQKKCIRNICKVGYLDHTAPLFKELKILKIEQIFHINCGKFIYQCYNNINYADFRTRLVQHNDIHDYSTRNKYNLISQAGRLYQFDNSSLNAGISIWNKLPHKIKACKSFPVFKSNLKEHILQDTLSTSIHS